MPVWHEALREAVAAGRVQIAGIIEEQHPDRCRLFMQWKRMEWPVLVDALNLLEVSAVPVVLWLDESGVVREVLRDPKGVVRKLTAEAATTAPAAPATTRAAEGGAVMERVRDRLFFERPPAFDDALKLLQQALAEHPHRGLLHFARGVAYRARYDSPQREAGDFQNAVDAWQAALACDPNQYIWRRRIQQYGPRLDKPYSFYDWVNEARRDIQARGETPLPLAVEPAGAELAYPAKALEARAGEAAEPDPEGRISRDDTPMIRVEATVVPSAVKPGQVVRVHLALRPDSAAGGHWNNEAAPMRVCVEAPGGWEVEPRLLTVPNAPQAVSEEARTVEFEVRVPGDASADVMRIGAYALYNVCTGPTGQCLYRRQDIAVAVTVVK